MEIAKSVSLFLVAGLCEIGGGYLVWLWLREGEHISFYFFCFGRRVVLCGFFIKPPSHYRRDLFPVWPVACPFRVGRLRGLHPNGKRSGNINGGLDSLLLIK